MRYQTEATPIYTREDYDAAVAAGAAVEYTACGCDYALPAAADRGSRGWAAVSVCDGYLCDLPPRLRGDRMRAFYPEPEA